MVIVLSGRLVEAPSRAAEFRQPVVGWPAVSRLSALSTQGPALDTGKLDQIAALPLGGRVKVNPWDDKVEMVKTAPVAITSGA